MTVKQKILKPAPLKEASYFNPTENAIDLKET
jgi:hypothetical protein